MADRYWVGGTANWDGTAGTKWSTTSGGSGGASVPTSSDNVFFDANSGSGTITVSGTRACLSLDATGFTGTLAGTSTPILQINNSMTLGSGMTVAGTLTNVNFVGNTAPRTLTSAGKSLINVTVAINTANTLTLQDNLTVTTNFTLTTGTLALSSYSLTAATFTNTSTSTRQIDFGTGKLVLTGSGVVFNGVITGFTTSGTTKIVEPTLASAQTITPGALTEANSFDISVPATAGNNTLTLTAGNYHSLTFGNATYTVANTAITVYGSLTINGTSPTFTAGTNAWTFAASATTETITTSGETLDFPITFNGASGTWQLQDALTVASGRTTTLTAGTLDLQSYTFTTGVFSSSNSNARTIAFGTGKIVLTGSGTVWGSGTATNLTTTGTTRIVEPALGAAQTITPGTPTEANTFDISVPATAGNFTLTLTGSDYYRNLTFGNATYTVANTVISIFGNLTINGTSPTFTAGTNTWTFQATGSTVQTITTNGKTLDFPITKAGSTTSTLQLQDAFTLAFTRTFTLSAGRLDLQSYTFTLGLFNSDVSAVRGIDFGSGKIVLGSTAVTVNAFDIEAGANLFTVTGTANNRLIEVVIPDATRTKDLLFGTTLLEANTMDVTVIAGGTGGIIDISGRLRNIILPNLTYTLGSNSFSIYGNFTIGGATPTITATAVRTFAATSGTQTITTNGVSIDFNITVNAPGATIELADALTLGPTTTRVFILQAGTLNLNNYTLTVPRFGSNYTNTRAISFGTGKIVNVNGGIVEIDGSGLTITGTKLLEIVANASLDVGSSWTEGSALNVNYIGGSGSGYAQGRFNNFSVENAAYSFNGLSTNITLYGNFTIGGSSVVWNAGTTRIKFAATSGTQLITTNGDTLGQGFEFIGTATYQLQDAVTISGGTSYPRIVLTQGALDLNDYTLTAAAFFASGSSVRSVDFGTGKIVLTLNDPAIYPSLPTNSSLNMTTLTNYSVSGSNLFELASTHYAIFTPNGTESTAPNISMLSGAWIFVDGTVNNLTCNGTNYIQRYSGTFDIYGDFTGSSNVNFLLDSGGVAPTVRFISTSGTKTITTNGGNINANVQFIGVGGTWIFGDDFQQSAQSSRVSDIFRITLSNGTLQFNGKRVSVNSFQSTSSNARALDFTGGGEIRIISDSSVYTGSDLCNINTNSTLTITNPSEGFLTAGTQGSDKSFWLGGSTAFATLPVIRNIDSSSTLTIETNSLVAKIYNLGIGSVSSTIAFRPTRTFTFENFGVIPAVGLTLTLVSATPGSDYTFSQSSGIISNQRLNITDSEATGGATWYAGSTSTDGGGNTGWIFANAPEGSSNMMLIFM